MAGENATGTVEKLDAGKGKRQRSSISFPYMDLREAIGVATTIHNNVATGPCEPEQLAPWMNQSPASSAFRNRLSAAKLFGFVSGARGEAVQLTDLGLMVVDAKRRREGAARAFLRVPLYSAIYNKFKGNALPPTQALEKEFVAVGVAETLTGIARQIFERSAEQAGFFETGRDRLVMPGFTPGAEERKGDDVVEETKKNGDGGGGDLPPVDPIIRGLLARLPKSGAMWPEGERKLWLQLLEGSFKLIYKAAPSSSEPVDFSAFTVGESEGR